MSKNLNLIPLIEAALFAAIAMVLSFVPDFASWFSPSFGAIPLVLFSLRRGSKYGLLAGLIWGLLHFVLAKVYYLSLSQVFIEYVIAFFSMGFAGITAQPFQNALKNEKKSQALFWGILGGLIGTLVRYFWHFVAGVIFWGSYAPEGMSPYWYSFTVNGTAGALTVLVVSLVLFLLISIKSSLFLAKK